ncbi:MAG TPA: DinB family protein [Anaerolineaceae bacterium]
MSKGGAMRASEIQLLYDYNYWANALILRTAKAAGEKVFLAPAAVSYGSLRGTLVHILAVEWLWRVRCQEGLSPASMPPAQDFPTLAVLVDRWQEEEQKMRAYLKSLNDDDLDRGITYTNTQGSRFTNPLWQLLVHLVNHGTQTRSEAGVVLTQAGFSPGNQDFNIFLREQKR